MESQKPSVSEWEELVRETTDDFCAAFDDPSETYTGAFARTIAAGVLPYLVNSQDPRVVAIVRKCQEVNLHARAAADVIQALGHFPAMKTTWDAMCYWLEGWYMREGLRVKVDWEPSRTWRAKMMIADAETKAELYSFEV